MNYDVPMASLCDEQVIKKSRFIIHIQRVKNKEEAKAFIEDIKKQYPDARHHCWAYIAGHPTATTDIGFSDDGEPSGTAGKPILNVLQHKHVGEIALVVVRYFGGIKLGAGGLVRAYSSSASLAMDQLQTLQLIPSKTFQITFNYNLESHIKHLLKTENISILQADYAEQVSLTLDIPESDIERLNLALIHVTSGKVSLGHTS